MLLRVQLAETTEIMEWNRSDSPARRIKLIFLCSFLSLFSCSQPRQALKPVAVSARPLLSSQRPEWAKDQGIVMASDMEALIFLRRRGGASADVANKWRTDLSAQTARTLKAEGINLVLINLYKGFGLKAEQKDMAAAGQFIKIAHQDGIKVGGYVGGTMMYETLFNEVPEARDWMQTDEWGHPIYYSRDQTFRYAACRNAPGYQAYIQKVLRTGIQNLHYDMIHFDQMMWWPEPYSCQNSYCRDQFREYLRAKYTNPQLEARLGFTQLANIIPPVADLESPPVRLQEMLDPLRQEWALFRCQSLAQRYGQYVNYIHQLNPGVTVAANPIMNPAANVGFIYGIDPERLFQHGDFFWTEEANWPAWTQDGRLISRIRSYKEARTMGKSLICWERTVTPYGNIPPGYNLSEELNLAEAIAYNDNNLGVVAGRDEGGTVLTPATEDYIRFFHAHQAELRHTATVADVAVLRSFASNQFNPWHCLFNTVLFEQTLIQGKLPFAIIFDKQLADLKAYKVLVLADQDALSDAQISAIRQFVREGGGLVATGNTSMLTTWRLSRSKLGLAGLLGMEHPPDPDVLDTPVRRTFGKGRVVYIPRIVPAIPPPPAMMSYDVSNQYWALPKNSSTLLDAVEWAAGGQLSAKIDAPAAVTMELESQPALPALLLHLVNYHTAQPVENISAQVRIPKGFNVKTVTVESPDSGNSQPLRIAVRSGEASFRVPRLKIYDLVVLRLQTASSPPHPKDNH